MVMTRENKTGRVKTPITVSSVQVYLLNIILSLRTIFTILTLRLHCESLVSHLTELLSLPESLHNCRTVRRTGRYTVKHRHRQPLHSTTTDTTRQSLSLTGLSVSPG